MVNFMHDLCETRTVLIHLTISHFLSLFKIDNSKNLVTLADILLFLLLSYKQRISILCIYLYIIVYMNCLQGLIDLV